MNNICEKFCLYINNIYSTLISNKKESTNKSTNTDYHHTVISISTSSEESNIRNRTNISSSNDAFEDEYLLV